VPASHPYPYVIGDVSRHRVDLVAGVHRDAVRTLLCQLHRRVSDPARAAPVIDATSAPTQPIDEDINTRLPDRMG
jgi:hypothetical protein